MRLPDLSCIDSVLTCFSFSTLSVYSGRAACRWALVGAVSLLALANSSCVRLASSSRYARSFSQSLPCAHAHSSHHFVCSLSVSAPLTVWYVRAVFVLTCSERL
eukprot:5516228-Pleurochrysis_carterae.AAC.1